MTDEELMQAYAEGDTEAFEMLYARHKNRLFGYLLGRMRDHDEAEEVFQLIFTKLHRARARYRGEIPFLPWFFTIARNTMIDHLRRAQVRQAHLTLDDEAVARFPAPSTEPPPFAVSLPGMESLSAAQRQILELRFGEGLTFNEIAAQLQLTPANARQIVSRQLARLRKLLTGTEV
ncbi:MAG: sigma-70 family RNA polymerase sigma factor [Desulfuromonadales bacterium]|nr:sigma-70 family RNA polymerase sigma factor [Desulfuromonadales bacterium]